MGYIYDELLSISELVLDRRELRELVFVGPIVYGVVALCAFGHGNLSSRLPVKIWIKLKGLLMAGATGIKLAKYHSG